jgi:hypothetical protein
MSSSSLINNSLFNKSNILNLNINNKSNILNLKKYYKGDFKIFKLKPDGTFDIIESKNRVIEVFLNSNLKVLGYFFIGIYDENTKSLINQPNNKSSNIGYIKNDNINLTALIRASTDAGLGTLEEWKFNDNGSIDSYYSLNGDLNLDVPNKEATLWIGTFLPFTF